MKCKDHPKMCDYYFSRGYYNDCAIGGVKWYFCPDSCGYCELLDAGEILKENRHPSIMVLCISEGNSLS